MATQTQTQADRQLQPLYAIHAMGRVHGVCDGVDAVSVAPSSPQGSESESTDDHPLTSSRPTPISTQTLRLSFAADRRAESPSLSTSFCESDRDSLLSKYSKLTFNERTWAEAYVSTATSISNPSKGGGQAKDCTAGAPQPHPRLLFQLHLPHILSDWDSDDEDHALLPEDTLKKTPPPKDSPPKHFPQSNQRFPYSKRLSFGIPHSSNSIKQNASATPVLLRRRSLSHDSMFESRAGIEPQRVQELPQSLYPHHVLNAKSKHPHRRFSRHSNNLNTSSHITAPPVILDDDDRFIKTVSMRLMELKELEQEQLRLHEAAEASGAQSAPRSRRSFFFSHLGLSSSSSCFSSSSVADPTDFHQSTTSLPTPSRSPHHQTTPVAHSFSFLHSKPQPTSLITFISRAFRPQGCFAEPTRPPRPFSHSPFPAPTQERDPKPHRASMPHVAWSSWSSNNSLTSTSSVPASATTTTTSLHRLSNTANFSQQHHHQRFSTRSNTSRTTCGAQPVADTTPGSTTPHPPTLAIRAILARALALFEMGATEAALATFQQAASTGDLFARFCVAFCVAYGYGCGAEPDRGLEMLLDVAREGEALAEAEVGILRAA